MGFDQINGGLAAHIARRIFHVVMITVVPIIYYRVVDLGPNLPANPVYFLLFLSFLILLFECLRLSRGWVFFGQRSNEKNRPSAFAWTSLALCFLLIFSPGISVTMSIALSCALVDPLVGECRRLGLALFPRVSLALVITLFIWRYFDFSVGVSVLMSLVTVFSEQPSFSWVDDNALMLLVPLGVYYLLCFFQVI